MPRLARPRRGDVLFLTDGRFTYVDRTVAALGATFEISDPQGESFLVVRAEDRDEELRFAVHDDGNRRAWRLAA